MERWRIEMKKRMKLFCAPSCIPPVGFEPHGLFILASLVCALINWAVPPTMHVAMLILWHKLLAKIAAPCTLTEFHLQLPLSDPVSRIVKSSKLFSFFATHYHSLWETTKRMRLFCESDNTDSPSCIPPVGFEPARSVHLGVWSAL